MATDSMQFIVNLLTNSWNAANTDSLTPEIDKITEYKRYNYNKNRDAIFIHRPQPLTKASGIGTASKDVIDYLRIDIRTLGQGDEAHWFKVVTEVERILDANMLNPGSSGTYCELKPDSQHEDLSDKTHHLWRIIIPIQLVNYTKSRS